MSIFGNFWSGGGSGSAPVLGPRITEAPSVSPGLPATVGVVQTRSPGTYAPRGGGSVAVLRQWLLGGTTVSTAATFTPTSAQLGSQLVYQETATETGGSTPGSVIRMVGLGPVALAAPGVPAAFGTAQWSLSDAATDGDLTLRVLALPADGGSALIGIERRIDGGDWIALGAAIPGTHTLTGLANGATVSVSLRAVNAVGAGAESAAKSAIPTAPVAATAPAAFAADQWTIADPATDGDLTLTVLALPADGGSPITALERRIDTGPWVALAGSGPGSYGLAGLTNGVPATLRLRAVNAVGAGPDSDAKIATPSAPAAVVPLAFGPDDWALGDPATDGDLTLTILTLPGDGGSPLTALEYRIGAGPWIDLGGTGTGPHALGGLPNGTPASISVRAVNAVGAGPESAPKVATPTAPAALGTIAVTSGSLRFPQVNRVPTTHRTAGMWLVAPKWTDTTANRIFQADGAFVMAVEVPWRAAPIAGAREMWLMGNANALSPIGNSIGIVARRSTVEATDRRIGFRANGNNVALSADLAVGGRERLFLAMRMAAGQMNYEVYDAGGLVASATPAMGAFAPFDLRSGVLVGALGAASTTIVNNPSFTAFDGAVGLVGYYQGAVTQADCLALARGADPLVQLTAANWRMLRRLSGTDTASLTKPAGATGDATAAWTVAGVAGQALAGSDVVPARAGSAWIEGGYVRDGTVWGVQGAATAATVPLSGRAEGVTGTVEARLFDATGQLTLDWTPVGTISGGAWSGSVTAPMNTGWGHFDVRAAAQPTLVHRARTRVGVGRKIGIMGQSQLEYLFRNLTPFAPDTVANITPAAPGAMSAAVQLRTGSTIAGTSAGSGVITLDYVSAQAPFSDGIAHLADYLPTIGITEPVCFVGLVQEGSTPQDLMDDTIPNRTWEDVTAMLAVTGADLSHIAINWITAVASLAAEPGGVAANIYDPLIFGLRNPDQRAATFRPGGANAFNVNHFLRDGTFPATMTVGISAPSRHHAGTGVVGPLDAGGGVREIGVGQSRIQLRDYAATQGLAFGPWLDDYNIEGSGTHPAQVAPQFGSGRSALRMLHNALRAAGVDTATDPVCTGASIDAGRTLITVAMARPNGGTLQTYWGFAGLTPPAGATSVQGFEVQNGGTGAWSRSGFTTTLSAGGVVLAKTSGTWGPGTRVRYLFNGPLDYGTATLADRLIHGTVYESGPQERGLGLPVAGMFEATV